VDFRRTWRDEHANMFRLPGIVACASDRTIIPTLIDVARDWSAERYQ
jgi:3'(2'), 5'-bisphosphate nucleotidase